MAARLLEVMPRQQALPAFTFVPGPDWDRKDAPGTFGDERARVEAFARFHERIEPHFIDNAGRNFDYGLDKLFLATGAAPTGLCNVWMHHGIYESARDEGCDLLLCADIGNQTFSAEGMWAPAEYFRAGKWSEAWRALESGYCVDKPLWRRFTAHCLGGQVGDPAWRSWQAFKGARTQSANELVGSLRAGTADRFDSVGRAKLRGVFYDRPTVGSRKAALFRAFSRGDKEGGEIELGFAQLYGIRTRDVTAYRPLVEFCAGLPTRMFMRGGQRRWLARQLGIGRLPEAQRLEGRHGVHNADWHARMTPHLADMRAEFVAASANPFLNAIIDYRKVIADIDSWPTQTRFDRDTQLRHAMGIARALLVTRFVKHVNGWNAY